MDRVAPLIVVWRIYESCSLACRFCAYSRTLARPRRAVDFETAVRFGRILSEYQHQFGRPVHVSWLGGEPLQWPRLIELSNLFHDTYRLGLGATTNGLPLASPAVRTMLLEKYEQLTVSIDGFADFHNWVRGEPHLFEQVCDNVCPLRSAADTLLLRVNTVLMRGNISRFAAFCDEMANWGFDQLTFNPLGGRDRPEFFREQSLLPEQVAQFCDELPHVRRRMLVRGLKVCGGEAYLQRMQSTARHQRIAFEDCLPGQRFLFIDERGRIAPCSFTGDGYGIELGEIHSAEDMDALPHRFAAARRTNCLAICSDCPATHVCEKFHVQA